MNVFKKIASVLLVLVTLVCFLNVGVGGYGENLPTEVTGVAGETVTVTFKTTPCYSTDGEITYSNINLFDGGITADGSTGKGTIEYDAFILKNSKAKYAFEVILTGKIASNATVGSYCDITFTYLRTDGYGVNSDPIGPDDLVKTVRVKVVERPAASSSSTPGGSSNTPSTGTPSTGTPSTGNTSTGTPSTGNTSTGNTTSTRPTVTSKPGSTATSKPGSTGTSSTASVDVDYTELNNQINICKQLKPAEYTTESFDKVRTATGIALAAQNSKDQAQVDAAAKQLKEAMAALVKIDITQLQNLLASVDEYLSKDGLSEAKDALNKAIDAANTALKSGDAQQINDAYNGLSAALQAYKARIDEMSEIVEVVDPHGPFCNIWLHRLWLVLLIISACLNVVFIVNAVLYFIRRRKQMTSDDMTLADYTIDGE